MASDSLSRNVIDEALFLLVEGDDGETLSGACLAELMQALEPFNVSNRMTDANWTPELRPLGGLDPLRAQAVRAAHALVWLSDSKDVSRDDTDDAVCCDRIRVEALRTALLPFGLLEREAEYNRASPAPVSAQG